MDQECQEGDPSLATTNPTKKADRNNVDKIHFVVHDVTDSRSYKVFLRPADISRLKISKVRRTLSSTSGKPPFSFDIWLRDAPLVGKEDATCAALGITPQSVLQMRPARGDVDKERSGELAAAASRVESNGVGEFTCKTTELNERQRALQQQLFEEAKRSHVFLTSADTVVDHSLSGSNKTGGGGGSSSGNNNNNNNGGKRSGLLFPSHVEQTLRSPDTKTGGTLEGYFSDNDVFTELMQEILDNKPIKQRGSPLRVEPEKCYTETHDEKLMDAETSSESPSGALNTLASLEIISQGVNYYDMYSQKDIDKSLVPPSVPRAHVSREEKEEEVVVHPMKEKEEGLSNQFLGARVERCPSMATQTRETVELAKLVEDLKDDVNSLLALQVRNETTKRALQRELFASQQLVKRLEKSEQESRQQLDVFFLRLRQACENSNGHVFSEEEIRTALRNMSILHQNELLQRENAALEQRLAEEVRKRRELISVLEDMKGHVRVLVRIRPPLRLLREENCAMEETKSMSVGDIRDRARMTVDEKINTITIYDAYMNSRQFGFYRIFSERSTQVDVFSEIAPLVQLACDGVNVSVLAYGQTGTGKTHSIFGDERQQHGSTTMLKGEKWGGKNNNTNSSSSSNSSNHCGNRRGNEDDYGDNNNNDSGDGIVPRTLRMLFEHLRLEAATEAASTCSHDDSNSHKDKRCSSSSMYEVSCSLLELHNDNLRDLLAPPHDVVTHTFQGSSKATSNQRGPRQTSPQTTLKVGSDGFTRVVGLTQHVVRDAGEALEVLRRGTRQRHVHAAEHNSNSSRSHLIFTIYLTQRRSITLQQSGGGATQTHPTSTAFKRLESKLVFVDLAGPERIAKSQAAGDYRLLETQHINKSLSALGDVVASLSNAASSSAGAVHIPYRNSTLTTLLQDVIGSRSKTVLLACVGPCDPPYENHTSETVATLQFASRVWCVRSFAPTFPSLTSGGGNSNKTTRKHSAELNVDITRGLSSRRGGGERLWMRPTKVSKQRTSIAAGRQNTGTVLNETNCTEDNGWVQKSAPSLPVRGNNASAEQRPKMRF